MDARRDPYARPGVGAGPGARQGGGPGPGGGAGPASRPGMGGGPGDRLNRSTPEGDYRGIGGMFRSQFTDRDPRNRDRDYDEAGAVEGGAARGSREF